MSDKDFMKWLKEANEVAETMEKSLRIFIERETQQERQQRRMRRAAEAQATRYVQELRGRRKPERG